MIVSSPMCQIPQKVMRPLNIVQKIRVFKLTEYLKYGIVTLSTRGGAAWKLVGLITRRSRVRIPPPLLTKGPGNRGLSSFSGSSGRPGRGTNQVPNHPSIKCGALISRGRPARHAPVDARQTVSHDAGAPRGVGARQGGCNDGGRGARSASMGSFRSA